MRISGPQQVVLVSTEADIYLFGKRMVKDNLFTAAWHMPVSKEPMLYAIAVGKNRFSLKLIRLSKVFIVNFMPYELRKRVLVCGTNSGAHIDKFSLAKLSREEGKAVHAPRVKEALGYLECEVYKEIDAGDHVIIVGKVLKAELKKKVKRIFHLEEKRFTTTVSA